MTQPSDSIGETTAVSVSNRNAASQIVLVCEHASNHIPDCYNQLGLSFEVVQSHVAWDPGAGELARKLADMLDCALVESRVSRLVYDCNRPPEVESAMPTKSEVYDIFGNLNLSPEDKTKRVRDCYRPFHAAVADVLTSRTDEAVLVTIHSFTPVYNGQARDVEIGVLHDSDIRFAGAMMGMLPSTTSRKIQYNQPYSAQDGVTHTLKLHGISRGILNVMLEIRNDLLVTTEQIDTMACLLSPWITEALASLVANGDIARNDT